MQFLFKLSAVLLSIMMATQIGAAPADSLQHKRIVCGPETGLVCPPCSVPERIAAAANKLRCRRRSDDLFFELVKFLKGTLPLLDRSSNKVRGVS
ncbi:hypothetical protein D9619_005101 [Psilocybe cf. subviscida]|uniref:Uncharacterized protein n=1 Tax=Psilocybe cf. subviscida TaxID=2480587 RepID=A0A8H5BPP7_9AGAR|nr:hypothetical protein D9619_005101 [Psilocybe cf. subviscida]